MLGIFVLQEFQRWGSTMDQLPMPVGLRHLGIRPGEFPETLWVNPWFERGRHSDGT
jgi:hypothetical protein